MSRRKVDWMERARDHLRQAENAQARIEEARAEIRRAREEQALCEALKRSTVIVPDQERLH